MHVCPQHEDDMRTSNLFPLLLGKKDALQRGEVDSIFLPLGAVVTQGKFGEISSMQTVEKKKTDPAQEAKLEEEDCLETLPLTALAVCLSSYIKKNFECTTACGQVPRSQRIPRYPGITGNSHISMLVQHTVNSNLALDRTSDVEGTEPSQSRVEDRTGQLGRIRTRMRELPPTWIPPFYLKSIVEEV